jgi:transcriptional regulator with XRE-family HTH domain
MESTLRMLREQERVTLETMSKNIGIAPGYVHQIEMGHRTVDFERAKLFANYYGVDILELFEPIRFRAKKIPRKTKE